MTRIVAGSASGRPLKVPAKGTRPTSERVREALFSRLTHMGVCDGTRVLDLYAGTGALGFEAVSRGAARADLVERSRPAAALIRENARTVGLADRVEVHCRDVAAHLTLASGGDVLGGDVDLVLIDPPYDVDPDEVARVLELLGPWIGPDSLVVVEASSRSPEPRWPDFLVREDRRPYGETVLWFAGPPIAEDGAVAAPGVDAEDEGAVPEEGSGQ